MLPKSDGDRQRLRQEQITEHLALIALFRSNQHTTMLPSSLENENSTLRSARGLATILDTGKPGDAVAASLQGSEQGYVLVLAKEKPPNMEDIAAAENLCSTIIRGNVQSWSDLVPSMLQWQKRRIVDIHCRPILAGIKALPIESLEPALRVYAPFVPTLPGQFISGAVAHGFLQSESRHSFSDSFTSIYNRLESVCERLCKCSDRHTSVSDQDYVDLERLTNLVCHSGVLVDLDFGDGTDEHNVNSGKEGTELHFLLEKLCSHTRDVRCAIEHVKQGHVQIQPEWVTDFDPSRSVKPAVQVDDDLLWVASMATSNPLMPDMQMDFKERFSSLIELWKQQKPIDLVIHPELRLILHCEMRGVSCNVMMLAASRGVCLGCAEWISAYNGGLVGLQRKWEIPRAWQRESCPDWMLPLHEDTQLSNTAFTVAGFCVPFSITDHAKKTVNKAIWPDVYTYN